MLAGLRLVDGKRIWSLKKAAPSLWRRLTHAQPWLVELMDERLARQFPVAPTLEPFEKRSSVRPTSHNRAFYLKHPKGAVVAVKGSESIDAQLERAFRQLTTWGRRWAITEDFPLKEQKLPYAVHVDEAVNEVKLTVRFLDAYVRHFDELPAFPIHLAVYRIADAMATSYFETIARCASERARAECTALGRNGLAVYLYYFPHMPTRVSHVVPAGFPGAGVVDAQSRDALLKSHGLDAKVATERFLSTVGRMLSLGYFPLSMASHGIGYCTSAQNVTVAGGMVDAESLHPFGKVKSDWEFATTFLTTMATLCTTLKVILYSPLPYVRFEFSDPSTVSIMLSQLVWSRVGAEVAAAAQRGVPIDPRLTEMLAPPSYEKIAALTHKMFPEHGDWFITPHFGPDNRGWD